MQNIGLLILAITQTGTAITTLASSSKTQMLGVKMLHGELSIYRYLLAGLWLAVSVIYFLGAFSADYSKAAVVLAIVNCLFEIIGYWIGLRPLPRARWFPVYGTLWMGIQGALVVLCAVL